MTGCNVIAGLLVITAVRSGRTAGLSRVIADFECRAFPAMDPHVREMIAAR